MVNKSPLRCDKPRTLRAIGISNSCWDKEQKKKYSIQFYDYDFRVGSNKITEKELEQILKIFPYDCFCYKTRHGIHFISFSLLRGSATTKARALITSKMIGGQNYWSERKDLTLRVSPKWKPRWYSKWHKNVSKKPQFKMIVKKPANNTFNSKIFENNPNLYHYRISEKHLEFYHKFMGLPDEIYELYRECEKYNYAIKLYNYKTRD